mmetsp:Transcript_23944/g.35891  ORF Transcript_23944/g.35891 Transcript_23944/m.35891 type:complete len:321 (+) Transcript_23944:160-1122(+)|eukprot:CAMPEP_0167755894 /NCGR_PEP_ID=MMETSP0110_2-20121227/9073_1 /TAXON_ID=629695 /ORGANISM="Gymnochlora sp., Strain CCMP2014" /LENGTH=320 /DNA_ID=CAMNT_0007641923 /DNA_START=67 /DNA_END=1029 /DNA_ORIENTATION=-
MLVGASKRKSDDLSQERLRCNRWERTVNAIESLGDGPKISLDSLDYNPVLSEEKSSKRLKRAGKLKGQKKERRLVPPETVLKPHEFKRFLSLEYNEPTQQPSSINLNDVPKFRRIESFVGRDEGFALFEASALLGKSSGSFERTEGLMNPTNGSLNRSKDAIGMQRMWSFKSFKSAKSEDQEGTFFDFSTANTDQKNLILGALPLLPKARPKPKPEPKKEEKDSKEEDNGEETESKDGSSSSKTNGEDEKEKKSEDKLPNPIGEDGEIREYTRSEKKKLIERYREKKKRRSFRKVIRYECRRKFAVSRPRVGGRFVKLKK